MTKTVLITGGAGYIGSVLAKKFVNSGYRVVVVDDLSSGSVVNLPPNCIFYQIDITKGNLEAIFRKEAPNLIYHLAASKSVVDSFVNPAKFRRINITGSKRVINAAIEAKVPRLIFTSTAAVYGDSNGHAAQKEDGLTLPVSPYGETKLETEQYLLSQSRKIQPVILRFANVYGPGGKSALESVVDFFVKQALSHKELIIHGDGSQTRDFIYIDDLAAITLACADLQFNNLSHLPIFNISTGRNISISEVAKLISRVTHPAPVVVYQKDAPIGQHDSVLSNLRTRLTFPQIDFTTLPVGIRLTVEELR